EKYCLFHILPIAWLYLLSHSPFISKMYPAHHENQLEGFFFLSAMRLWKHFFPLLYYRMSYLGRLGRLGQTHFSLTINHQPPTTNH
ncbi:MAG: hypothetical protein II381_06615, partial [Victivallales bacterium]|nr:hypothetical protein [Victivallales bacterium]